MSSEKETKKRPIIQVRYLPQAGVRPIPDEITRCPEADCDDRDCEIKKYGWRKRKTGPLAWLALRVCNVHRGGLFTLYHHGMLPKKRRSFLDGSDLLFDAVIDGASEKKWPEEATGKSATFKTQKRHIRFFCSLFGVEPDQTDDERRFAALCLDIPTMKLRDEASKIRAGPTWKCRARVVVELLRNLGKIHLSRLLSRGHQLNFWGKPTIDKRNELPFVDFSTA